MRPTALLARALCAALALCAVTAEHARAYDMHDFHNALEGYLLGNLGQHGAASMRLYNAARDTGSLDVFADASHEAILAGDYEMATKITHQWYESGGGVDALRRTASLHAEKLGPTHAVGVIAKLATESDPSIVYAVLGKPNWRWRGESAEAMLAAHPSHLRGVSFWAHLALLQLRTGAVQDAQASVDKALDKEPDAQSALVAALRVATDDTSAAQRVALADRLATAASMPLADALAAYGVWNWSFNNSAAVLPDSLSEMEGAARAEAGSGYYDRTRIGAGHFLQENNEPERALAQYRQLSDGSPLSAYALEGRLKILEQLGRDSEAQQLIDKAMADATPERSAETALLVAAHVNRISGPQQAHDILATMAEHAEELQIIYQRSLYAEQAGRLDQAELALREYIRLAPEDAEGYNALGYIFADHNTRLEEAGKLIGKALEISPNTPNIVDSHGWLLYRLGKHDEALDILYKSMHAFGDQPPAEVVAHVGEVLWVKGNKKLARQLWMGAYKNDPDNKVLLEAIRRFGAFDL